MSGVKNYSIIDTNQTVSDEDFTGHPVINCVAWDKEASPDYDFHAGHGVEDGLIAVASDTAGIGHLYDPETETFHNPNHDKGE